MKNGGLWFLATLAVLLIVGVFLRHDSAFIIAAHTGGDPRVIFHILGGMLEILQWGVIFVLMLIAFSPTGQHAKFWVQLAQLACVIGIIESLLLTGCSIYMTTEPVTGTVCRHVTGLPIGWTVKVLELAAYTALIGRHIWWLFRGAHEE